MFYTHLNPYIVSITLCTYSHVLTQTGTLIKDFSVRAIDPHTQQPVALKRDHKGCVTPYIKHAIFDKVRKGRNEIGRAHV